MSGGPGDRAGRHHRSLDAAYFDRLYAADGDPWRFASSEYERRKYEATLAALPRQHYRRALEVGCSIGILTVLLAARCDRLLAIDGSTAPLVEARRRCADLPHVAIERRMVPRDFPGDAFDLIVLSEVAYYWDRVDLRCTASLIGGSLEPGGDLVLVHWLGATDYPASGDDAAEGMIAAVGGFARLLMQHRAPEYRLDVLRRSSPLR